MTEAASISAAWFVPPDLTPTDKSFLRLDSNIYRYVFNEDTIEVEEVYTVKAGPVFTNPVAVWSEENGLMGRHMLNKYHRYIVLRTRNLSIFVLKFDITFSKLKYWYSTFLHGKD